MIFRLAVALLLGATLTPLPGQATEARFPTKPIRYIVPFPAGGPTDAIARPLAQRLSELAGQPVVVDNRAGAAGGIGAAAAAAAPADGYTLFHGTISNMAINVSLYASLPYDPVEDFRALTTLVTPPSIVVVRPDFPANTLPELLAWAKANPGKATYASGGSGTTMHLAAEMLADMAGIKLVHVPYRGGAQAIADLIGGQTMMMIDSMPTALPMIRAGKLKGLAITTPERVADLPELPTVAEAGYRGYEVLGWHAAFVPAGTPQAIVDRLNGWVVEAMNSPAVVEQMRKLGSPVRTMSPEQTSAFIAEETAKWARIVRSSGAKVD